MILQDGHLYRLENGSVILVSQDADSVDDHETCSWTFLKEAGASVNMRRYRTGMYRKRPFHLANEGEEVKEEILP